MTSLKRHPISTLLRLGLLAVAWIGMTSTAAAMAVPHPPAKTVSWSACIKAHPNLFDSINWTRLHLQIEMSDNNLSNFLEFEDRHATDFSPRTLTGNLYYSVSAGESLQPSNRIGQAIQTLFSRSQSCEQTAAIAADVFARIKKIVTFMRARPDLTYRPADMMNRMYRGIPDCYKTNPVVKILLPTYNCKGPRCDQADQNFRAAIKEFHQRMGFRTGVLTPEETYFTLLQNVLEARSCQDIDSIIQQTIRDLKDEQNKALSEFKIDSDPLVSSL